jgi:hypothetical protein
VVRSVVAPAPTCSPVLTWRPIHLEDPEAAATHFGLSRVVHVSVTIAGSYKSSCTEVVEGSGIQRQLKVQLGKSQVARRPQAARRSNVHINVLFSSGR